MMCCARGCSSNRFFKKGQIFQRCWMSVNRWAPRSNKFSYEYPRSSVQNHMSNHEKARRLFSPTSFKFYGALFIRQFRGAWDVVACGIGKVANKYGFVAFVVLRKLIARTEGKTGDRKIQTFSLFLGVCSWKVIGCKLTSMNNLANRPLWTIFVVGFVQMLRQTAQTPSKTACALEDNCARTLLVIAWHATDVLRAKFVYTLDLQLTHLEFNKLSQQIVHKFYERLSGLLHNNSCVL